MKLFPLPAATLTAWAAVPSMDEAVRFLGLAHQHLGPGLTGFEVMNQFSLSLVDKHFPHLRVPLWQQTPWCVLLENADNESEAHARERFEALMEAAMESACVTDAVVAESLAQARNLWHIRENITLAQAEEGLNIKHDISIPISAIPAFVRETDAELAAQIPGARFVDFGHLGDGNLHYNVQCPPDVPHQEFLEREEARRVLGVAELVRRRLVERQCAGTGGRIGRLPGVDLPGLERPIGVGHVRVPSVMQEEGVPLALTDGGRHRSGPHPEHPAAEEGCRPASRGFVLVLVTVGGRVCVSSSGRRRLSGWRTQVSKTPQETLHRGSAAMRILACDDS